MANKIITEAERKASPRPVAPNGYHIPRDGGGQKVSNERGVHTRSKKNPGKRANQG